MPQRRRPTLEITPAYEDSGLFQSAIVQIMVELVPQMTRNDRNDLVVRGFVERTIEIEVGFAGRRTKEAAPLETHLRAILSKARTTRASLGGAPPDVDMIRCPVLIEGAWRPRFKRDTTGWETRSYYLFAARWSLVDDKGETVSFGCPPVRG